MTRIMRTTLDLDEDVLAAARALAVVQRRSMGKVVSEILRKALAPKSIRKRSGVPMLPRRPGVIVSDELIDKLRQEEGI